MERFYCPVEIVSGPNALSVLKTAKASRVLVVTDRFFAQSGKAGEIGALVPGALVRIFDRVVPDPPASLVAEGAALCRDFQPDLLIALGGGSPMDCAKAIRLAAEGSMTFAAIPTTSGSGSEVTSFAILTHNGVKHPLVDKSLRPDLAILDDSLLEDLPKPLIADTGMDLLAHCLEALAATGRSKLTDALAMDAAQTVLESLAASYNGDKTVRGALHLAATMAGMAFDNAGLGLCHALAHALGVAAHLPHGRLCAMVLPHVLEYNTPALPQYAALARRIGLSAPTDKMALRSLIAAITRLRSALDLPATLAQADKGLSDPDKVIGAALADPCCRTNPVPVTREAVEAILKAVRG